MVNSCQSDMLGVCNLGGVGSICSFGHLLCGFPCGLLAP